MKLVILLSLLLLGVQSISGTPIRLYKQYLIGALKAYLQTAHPLEGCPAKYAKGTLCMQIRTTTYNLGREGGKVIGTISFIVPDIIRSYLDQNPIVGDFRLFL